MTTRLGIIGGGNMGLAIVRGSIEAGVLEPQAIVVAEIDPARRAEVARSGCSTVEEPRGVLDAEQIMLAVKPQSFPDVGRALGPLGSPKVVISIMAGLGSRAIRAALGEGARVVRVMPNMPCQVGAGMAAIALGEGARAGDETLAQAVLGALGETVMVDESLMYAVTAVSGSGPAYVFLLAEAMQKAAVGLGIDADAADRLVRQTVFGSGKLLVESGATAAELRRAVTSPGGTTEAALKVMLEGRLPEMIAEAITAARDRGVELDQ